MDLCILFNLKQEIVSLMGGFYRRYLRYKILQFIKYIIDPLSIHFIIVRIIKVFKIHDEF